MMWSHEAPWNRDGAPGAGEMMAPTFADCYVTQLAFPFWSEMAPEPGSLPSLQKALDVVPEHRRPRGYRKDEPPYPLIPMLLLLLIATLCGRRGYQAVAEWAADCAVAHPELLDALGCPVDRRRRTPVAATFFRCVRDMALRVVQQTLQEWLIATMTVLDLPPSVARAVALPPDQVALDGKTARGAALRRQHAAQDSGAGLHLFAAYMPALHVVLDQVCADSKGQELTMARLLLGSLPLRGRVYTADAELTQRDLCQTICAGGGDYLFPVKGNQPTLLRDIEEAFSPSAPAGGRSTAAA
jgi:hypothetical protein